MVGSVTTEKLFLNSQEMSPRTPRTNRVGDRGGLSTKDRQTEVEIGDTLVTIKCNFADKGFSKWTS